MIDNIKYFANIRANHFPATRGNAAYTYTYSETGLNGFYQLFTDYAPDLLNFNFDNAIKSVYQTGM